MQTPSKGAYTSCSELYHDLQLSQKCPNFSPEISGVPVNTRVSGEREYPAMANKQNTNHTGFPSVKGAICPVLPLYTERIFKHILPKNRAEMAK